MSNFDNDLKKEKAIIDSIKIRMGLEIHITLKSKKKIFNWEDVYNGEIAPNSKVGPWELGYLGVLPIINPEVIEIGIKLALALGMKIEEFVIFDRKLYNYFDLPKGFQITQHNFPLAVNGFLPIIFEGGVKKIPIKCLQLEEDTAKTIYFPGVTKLDYNRAGNPLLELVTKPVFTKVETVLAFIKQLQTLLMFLDISESKMEKGQIRIDLNYSLKIGKDYSSPRYEIKNLNSLGNLQKSLRKEMERHIDFFNNKQNPKKSFTLGFSENLQENVVNREKIKYFYVPEHNIPPIKINKQDINRMRKEIPTLPWVYWRELLCYSQEKIDKIISQTFLLRTLTHLMKKKDFCLIKDIFEWSTFCFNYLPSVSKDENGEFFKEKTKYYFRLFQTWKAKKLNNQEIKSISENIFTKNYHFSLTSFERAKKTVSPNELKLIEKKLKSLWDEKKTPGLTNKDSKIRQKIFSFLLREIKLNFPSTFLNDVVRIINSFLDKKTGG